MGAVLATNLIGKASLDVLCQILLHSIFPNWIPLSELVFYYLFYLFLYASMFLLGN